VPFLEISEPEFDAAVARQLIGAQVLSVDGHPVDGVLAAVEPLISRDNDQRVTWLGPEVLAWTPLIHALGLISDPGQATLAVRFPDQTTVTVAVESVAVESVAVGPQVLTGPRPAGWISLPDTVGAPMPLYLRNSDAPYWFEYLPDSAVVYLQLNGVGDQPLEAIAAFCERLFTFIDNHQVSKLVIDLRWNGGGNTYLVQPLLHSLIGWTKINQRGCLYVIIGRGTFSAAQNTATAIERETNAIFVGEPSGSRPNVIGETIPFMLPYRKALVNVADLYWQTSWRWTTGRGSRRNSTRRPPSRRTPRTGIRPWKPSSPLASTWQGSDRTSRPPVDDAGDSGVVRVHVSRAEFAMDEARTVMASEDGSEAIDCVPRSREQPDVDEPASTASRKAIAGRSRVCLHDASSPTRSSPR